MSIFSKLLQITIDVATLPVDILADFAEFPEHRGEHLARKADDIIESAKELGKQETIIFERRTS